MNDVLNREEITGYTCKAGNNVFPAKIKGRIKSEHLHTIIMMMKIRGRGANRKDRNYVTVQPFACAMVLSQVA